MTENANKIIDSDIHSLTPNTFTCSELGKEYINDAVKDTEECETERLRKENQDLKAEVKELATSNSRFTEYLKRVRRIFSNIIIQGTTSKNDREEIVGFFLTKF